MSGEPGIRRRNRCLRPMLVLFENGFGILIAEYECPRRAGFLHESLLDVKGHIDIRLAGWITVRPLSPEPRFSWRYRSALHGA